MVDVIMNHISNGLQEFPRLQLLISNHDLKAWQKLLANQKDLDYFLSSMKFNILLTLKLAWGLPELPIAAKALYMLSRLDEYLLAFPKPSVK